jgi:hypothetical protein
MDYGMKISNLIKAIGKDPENEISHKFINSRRVYVRLCREEPNKPHLRNAQNLRHLTPPTLALTQKDVKTQDARDIRAIHQTQIQRTWQLDCWTD